uniref:Bm1620 n=1 Tax=Brugia malayi TaxID=6279 RepID=A0A1I9G5Y0_BRUMA|nr:Bm1620 [Brugia malayi]
MNVGEQPNHNLLVQKTDQGKRNKSLYRVSSRVREDVHIVYS